MNRRDWMKSAGALGIAATLPIEALSLPQAASGAARIETEIKRLKLTHTWTTHMSSSDYRDVIYMRYTRDGVTGYGEGAPIVRYKEDAAGAEKTINSVKDYLVSANPWEFEKVMAEIFRRVPGEHAAKAAMDIALMDWVGQKLGIPLYRHFGLDPADAPITTFSIGVDDPSMTRQKVEEAAQFPVLKIKMGVGKDEDTLKAIRAVTKKHLRVDANEGWSTKEEAVEKINWLAKDGGVEFVEQPMPADKNEDIRWVSERAKLPIIADESCISAKVIPHLHEVGFSGVNVKLDKAGGVLEAHRWISIAKALGMKTMLGCMISSSVSVSAAAHLSPLVDYADLDGNLLISNDPFHGVRVKGGKLVLPNAPGLGLTPAKS
jgi:L-alanine-DL-glutamate epimerase-like enolase superfamily enzyme